AEQSFHKIIGYMRVSTDGQDLQNQKMAIQGYADKHGLKIDEFFELQISSRKTLHERRIGELFEKLTPGSLLITSELSRLGRSVGQVVTIMDELVKKHIHVICLKEGIELKANGEKDIQSTVMITMFSLFAELERKLISMRTKEALQARKAQGIKLGRPKGVGKSKLDAHKKEIISLLKNGSTKTFIAERFGTTVVNFHYWLKKHNVKIFPEKKYSNF
ncbi:MAG: recombinase family protein, partial [Deltaproteobacteria bacterium]|nr:recombinase family protein [Deltaproteobacteria bacterium]